MAAAAPEEAFTQKLIDLGYVEGRNLVFEFRSSNDKYDRVPVVAKELVRLNVDLMTNLRM